MTEEEKAKVKAEKTGWGVENLPYPTGPAFIHSRERARYPDEKAELISKRLHPLKKDTVGRW